MRFAKVVFVCAGIWGLAVLPPFFWLVDITGRHYEVPTQYPQFFYGFMSITLAWQLAFLVIGSNPARFRPLMLPSILEKFGYVVTLVVLYAQERVSRTDAQALVPDLILGVLFIASFVKTRAVDSRDAHRAR
jgi:hypothetical protein